MLDRIAAHKGQSVRRSWCLRLEVQGRGPGRPGPVRSRRYVIPNGVVGFWERSASAVGDVLIEKPTEDPETESVPDQQSRGRRIRIRGSSRGRARARDRSERRRIASERTRIQAQIQAVPASSVGTLRIEVAAVLHQWQFLFQTSQSRSRWCRMRNFEFEEVEVHRHSGRRLALARRLDDTSAGHADPSLARPLSPRLGAPPASGGC